MHIAAPARRLPATQYHTRDGRMGAPSAAFVCWSEVIIIIPTVCAWRPLVGCAAPDAA
jgi:hypothetical protein